MWQSQKKKTRAQRLGYLKDHPFYMPPLKKEKSQHKYLLIDDVCASSSSLMACAQTLENNGYNVSAFLVLSRVELEQEPHYPSSRIAEFKNEAFTKCSDLRFGATEVTALRVPRE